jgi:hypothetical protein
MIDATRRSPGGYELVPYCIRITKRIDTADNQHVPVGVVGFVRLRMDDHGKRQYLLIMNDDEEVWVKPDEFEVLCWRPAG